MTADSEDLAALTMRFVHGSGSYHALGPRGRELADAALVSATSDLTGRGPAMLPAVKPQFIEGYKAGVRMLVLCGWLTATQASDLAALADSL